MTRVRLDGGVTGSVNNPTASVAGGMWSLKDHEKYSRSLLWPVATAAASPADPYFNLNTLLLHGDGTNGANNTTFVDSSTNAYTLTPAGRPLQGTFSPFSQTGWSLYLGGSSALTIPYSSTNFAFHTTDFTVEAWIYPTSYTSMTHGASNIPTIIGAMVHNTTTADWSFGLTTSGILKFYYYNGAAVSINSSTTVPLNTWSHIAMTKTSSGISLFYNGSLVSGPTAISGTPATSSTTVSIGGHNSTYISSCHVSNARIVKGTALYTGSYTVPTTPLTAVTNTTLLAFQDNRFKDNSTIASAFTAVGTPRVQAFEPFAPSSSYSASSIGGSAYFNGSTDYITLPNNMSVVGSNAYTLEGWFYPTNVSSAEIPLVKLYNSTQTIELRIASAKIQGRINDSATVVGGNSTIYANQWYHFALVKPTAGTSTAVLYINGVAETTTASDTFTYTAFTTPRIGANQGPTLYCTGWISGVRFLNGTAQYTSNFTPPTAPPTNIGNTLFLTNFTNSGIIDSTAKNNLTTFGGATINTTISKFGSASMTFNGTTDYLTYPYTAQLSLLEADFTIEAWVYITSASTQSTLITFGSETTNRFVVAVNTARQLIADIFGTATNTFTGATVTLNSWTHVAVVRSGSTITGYLNGSSVGSATSSATLGNSTGGVTVGRGNSSEYFIGYIDDMRVTKGYARYTANFTPPTTAFSDQ